MANVEIYQSGSLTIAKLVVSRSAACKIQGNAQLYSRRPSMPYKWRQPEHRQGAVCVLGSVCIPPGSRWFQPLLLLDPHHR